MQWRDEGVLLAVRRHGETAAIIEVLTAEHGRHAGVVRGGTNRKLAPVLQPGAQLQVTWSARLDAHIGTYTVEPLKSRAADLMQNAATLAALNAVTALLSFALPEREAVPETYDRTIALLDMIGNAPHWEVAYLMWELRLLEALGFALDLDRCAVTGATEGLTYVSPKTGRAVSEAGAGAWSDRLLPLSPALLGRGAGSRQDVIEGLRTTGHFLDHWLAPALGDKPVPAARQRFVDTLGRRV